MKTRLWQFFFVLFLAAFSSSALCQADTIILSSTSANYTITSGSDEKVYGTFASNQITLEAGAKAELINFPGSNSIQIQSSSGLFTVSRSGSMVTFEGSDGTILKIPTTTDIQTISFNEEESRVLQIHNNQVMLDDQVIATTSASIEGGKGSDNFDGLTDYLEDKDFISYCDLFAEYSSVIEKSEFESEFEYQGRLDQYFSEDPIKYLKSEFAEDDSPAYFNFFQKYDAETKQFVLYQSLVGVTIDFNSYYSPYNETLSNWENSGAILPQRFGNPGLCLSFPPSTSFPECGANAVDRLIYITNPDAFSLNIDPHPIYSENSFFLLLFNFSSNPIIKKVFFYL